MPEIDALSTGKKVGNTLDETLRIGGGATTATTPTVTIPRETATTNTVEPALRLERTSTGTPANGIGVSQQFFVETAAGNTEIGATIEAVTTDVTAASEDFDLVFNIMAAGAAAVEMFRIKSTKAIVLPAFTSSRLTPNIMFGAVTTGTIFHNNSSLRFTAATNDCDFYIGASGVRIIAGGNGYGFAGSATDASAAVDTAFNRAAAGVASIDNGTPGAYRDIIYRIRATGAAAPTIASAGTIAPTVAITIISGTAAIATITAPAPISTGGGTITLIPTGIFTWTTAGNIALAGTAVVGKALTMTYDTTTTKWYPSYTA